MFDFFTLNSWIYMFTFLEWYLDIFKCTCSLNPMYCTVLYCTVLYCTVLYCTVLYCTVLYCTVPYCYLSLNCTKLHLDLWRRLFQISFPSRLSRVTSPLFLYFQYLDKHKSVFEIWIRIQKNKPTHQTHHTPYDPSNINALSFKVYQIIGN